MLESIPKLYITRSLWRWLIYLTECTSIRWSFKIVEYLLGWASKWLVVLRFTHKMPLLSYEGCNTLKVNKIRSNAWSSLKLLEIDSTFSLSFTLLSRLLSSCTPVFAARVGPVTCINDMTISLDFFVFPLYQLPFVTQMAWTTLNSLKIESLSPFLTTFCSFLLPGLLPVTGTNTSLVGS